MANNIRENSAPLPVTEPKSGEGEKGISVKSTAHSQQKDHMKKSPVEPRNGRGEKGGNSKENRRKQSLSPKRSKSRRERGRSRERRNNRRAYRKGAADPTKGSPRRSRSQKRNKSKTASPTRSPSVKRKESPPKKGSDKRSWGSRSPYRSPSVVRKDSPPKKSRRDRRRSITYSEEEYSDEGSLSGSSGSRSPYDSDELTDTADEDDYDDFRSYSRDRSGSRSKKPSRKRSRDKDDDDASYDGDYHEAKKARFNALEEEEIKWKLSKDDVQYVNDKMRVNIPPKKVKDMILKDMPVPSNLGKIPRMDEFWEDKLEKRDPGRLILDNDLANIQDEIRDTTGPLLKLWKTIDRANDGNSSLDPKELLDMTEKSITLVGRAISNITHKRRVRVLSRFSKDKRKVATTLSKFEKPLRLSKTRLFGSKVVKKIERRIRAKKKTSTVDVDHLFEKKQRRRTHDYRPSGRHNQPFDQPAASTDRNAGGSRQVVRDNYGNNPPTPRGGGKSRSSKRTGNPIKTSKGNTKQRTPSRKGSLHRRYTSYPSRRKVKTLHKKLGKNHKRSKHSECHQRSEARLHTKTSSTSRTSSHKNGKGGQTSHATRNREHAGKRGNPTHKTIKRSICEHRLPSEKEGRGAKTYHKPEKTQQKHTLHPFQNGIHKSSKRLARTGRSDGKTRSERCLLLRSTSRKHAKIHEVQMGRNPVRVRLPLLRTRSRTKGLHKNYEGPDHSAEKTKHTSHHLSRRYAHTGKNHRRSNKKLKHSNLLPGTPRICHKHKEISNIPNKGNRILRVSNKLNKHDNSTPTQKNRRHHKNVPKNLEKPNHQSKKIVRITGEADFNISSSSTGPHKIQTHPTMPNKGGETETGDGTKNPPQHHGSGGVELVDQQHENPERKANKNQIPRSYNQRRCGVNSGMGCTMPKFPDRGSMNTGGEGSPHQHIRDGGSMFCHQNLHQRSEKPISASEIRQHNDIIIFSKNGGTKNQTLSRMATQIWSHLIDNNINLTVEHIAGKDNIQADWESRNQKDSSEWKLDPSIFQALCQIWGFPTVDLFASRISHQLENYYAWKPDPYSQATDAMQQDWTNLFGYAFPPFSMVGKVIRKMINQQSELIMITPLWQSQSWYPLLLQTTTANPILLPKTQSLLRSPEDSPHPLLTKGNLKLVAWRLSGKRTHQESYRQTLLPSWSTRGERAHNLLTQAPGHSGKAGVWREKLIPLDVL